MFILCISIRIKMSKKISIFSFLLVLIMACATKTETTSKSIRLITLDPGHFHAALIQKTMYSDVDSVVHVYAPEGIDLQLHLDRVKVFNTRNENPTHWNEEMYTGP